MHEIAAQMPPRRTTASLALLLALALAGCQGESSASTPVTPTAPVAAFGFTPASPAPGQVVTFTHASTGSPTAFAWTFGDGAASVDPNPTHSFAAAGTYTVTLTVSSSGGTSAPVNHDVVVSGGGGGGGGPTACTPATGAADCSAAGACPADAALGCSCALRSQGYVCVPACTTEADCPSAPGQSLTCTAGLCVGGGGGGGGGGGAPAASFGVSPSNPVASQLVAFTDTSTGSPTSWLWTFGDGATSTAQHPTHAYASSGTYTVSLAATNASGTDTATSQLTVGALAPGQLVAGFIFSPVGPVGGETVTFTDTTVGNPTAWFWRFGDGATSTAQHPTHVYSAATSSGTFMVTLIVSTATASAQLNRDVTVAAAPKATGSMSSVDTVSDQAQAMTIAFDGLAFITGSFCAQTFYPPGKVADFFGFQWLRDNDPSALGHNTEFTTLTADPVIALLDDTQLGVFDSLEAAEASYNDAYAYGRFPLAKGFRRAADGAGPASRPLSRQATREYSGALFEIDGHMSYLRATAYAAVLRGLSVSQQATLAALKSAYLVGGVGSWTQPAATTVAAALQRHPGHMMRTYAGEMLAWYLGTRDADVYFCPEREGTYFGSFFMKDVKAMANPGTTIDANMTADMGDAFLAALDAGQRSQVTGLLDLQRPDLMAILVKRDQISAYLRTALAGATLDETAVVRMARQYGQLDGEISWYYATHFATVSGSLTAAQRSALVTLRQTATTQTTPTVQDFDAQCTTAWLYSSKLQSAPAVRDTDFLFGVCGAAATSCTEDWDCCSYACTGAVGAKTCAAPFTFTSSAFLDGDALPSTYTCDNPAVGNDAPNPPLAWSGAPAGTAEYAITLTTYGLNGPRWNWILYGIPAGTTSIAAGNLAGIGTPGLTTDGTARRYYPPCAQGAGTHSYTFTLHALSGSPTLGVPASQVDGWLLEERIAALTLATRQLTVTNTR